MYNLVVLNHNKPTLIRWIILITLAGTVFTFLQGCAVPVSPTGGPRDTDGPVILRTEPANEAVNVSKNRIVIYFDEHIDRNSVRNNIRLEPDLDLPYTIEFKKKRVEILFDEDLPENTTIALHLPSAIMDVRRNSMTTAQKIAFSTGPKLARGEATLKVQTFSGEMPESGTTIYLFRQPANLETDKAMYIAEPDTSGTAVFSYLSDGEYIALYFNDFDRDRTWDTGREPAQPIALPSFRVDNGSAVSLGELTIQQIDTTQPRILGAGVPLTDVLRLRFNKPIQLTPESYVGILKVDGTEYTRGFPVPFPTADEEVPRTLLFQTLLPLNEDSLYSLQPVDMTDSNGQPLLPYTETFNGNRREQDEPLRYTGFEPAKGLTPSSPLDLLYSGFLTDEQILDSLKIIVNNELIPVRSRVEVQRNRLRIAPFSASGRTDASSRTHSRTSSVSSSGASLGDLSGDSTQNDINAQSEAPDQTPETWSAGNQYRFVAWNPYTQEYRSVEPEIWYEHRLGEIALAVADSTLRTWNLRLFSSPFEMVVDTVMSGRIQLQSLKPGTYHLQLFLDENGNGAWDMGQVKPYIKPEPIIIRRDIPVTEGFTSDIQIEAP